MSMEKTSHKELARLCWESYSKSENFGTFSCLWKLEEDKLICAFTGSNDRVDWIYNSRIYPILSEIPGFVGKCHIGYMDLSIEVARCLRMVIEGRHKGINKLILTGHSLGGALAVMTSLRLPQYNPEVITFGSPKIFNKEGSRNFSLLVPSTHYINGMDLVPHIGRMYSYYRNTHWLNKPSKILRFVRQYTPLSLTALPQRITDHGIEKYYEQL